MRFLMSLALLCCCLMLAVSVQAQTVRSLNLVANRILYEPVSGKIYASVPSSAGSNGNSIATIDPATATILAAVGPSPRHSDLGRSQVAPTGWFRRLGYGRSGRHGRRLPGAGAPSSRTR